MQSEFGKLPSTPQSPFLNNLPTSVKAFIRPMLFASLGLHLLLMFAPLPGEKEPPKPAPEKTVKVTQLPPASKPNSTAKPLAKLPIAPLPRPVIRAARPNSITIPSPIRPRTVEAAPAPVPSTAPATAASITPAASNPFADFPRYANATSGSFDSLPAALNPSSFQTSDSLATVEAFFKSELPKKQFEAGEPTNLGSVKVIQVTKGGVTQYLHLFARAGKGTVYLLAPTPIDINSLPKDTVFQNEPPEKIELTQLFTELADTVNFVADNGDTQLQDPTTFLSAKGIDPEYGKVTSLGEGTTVPLADVDALLQAQIANIGFTVTPSSSFAGSTVYQITKNSFTRYLAIAPTNDGGGWVYIFDRVPGT